MSLFQTLIAAIFSQLRGAKVGTIRLRSLPWLLLGTLVTATIIGFNSTMPLLAQNTERWLEVNRIAGPVMIQTSAARPAQLGDRLVKVGDELITRQQASANLSLDTGIGSVAVAQNTQLRVQRLDTLADGARITVLEVDRGQARIQARPFTNPNTRLELQTPSGIAAVRGTDFGVIVDDAGKTSIGTVEGTVEVTAESVSVTVDEGLATLIRPGEPPTTPTRLDRELNLEWFQLSRRGNTLVLAGRIEPTNSLTYRDTEIPISRTGYFAQTVRLGSANRSVVFVVQNPLGESRQHRLNSWQVNDIER